MLRCLLLCYAFAAIALLFRYDATPPCCVMRAFDYDADIIDYAAAAADGFAAASTPMLPRDIIARCCALMLRRFARRVPPALLPIRCQLMLRC